MKNKLVLAMLAVFGLNVEAANLNKTYLEIGYSQTELDDTEYDATGYKAGAGYEFDNGIFVGFNYRRQKDTLSIFLRETEVEFDENIFEIGYIIHEAQNGRFSIAANMGKLDIKQDNRTTDFDLARFYTEYEHSFNKYFSAFAQLGYENYDATDVSKRSGARYGGGLKVYFGASSVSLEYFKGRDFDQSALMYRYSF
ncbi:hypothetical protein [Pseudoalteromonas luteoviolacea]|uniref:Outer membrane protein beta-barrel domain-containing protein n=1 Tax=Pseudoalteromonas luteoviolacea S4060-1 TaxID=1365257 RepID=A0A167P0F5_9GAMM|nr:hypothetical protein [Pseudoalteromonas luteoviolacea]KZN69235.1 hypothetical protein N478_11420 [Pseudoalteromonas luteoviolacea S4060-1]